MKGPSVRLVLPALCLLAPACASLARPAPMPAYEPALVVTASAPTAPQDDHDDPMRMPRPTVPLPDLWPAQGLYIGGLLSTSQPLDDFDGGVHYVLSGSPNEELIVPDTDVGAGAGIYVSYRWRMNEVLVQYSISEHDGDGVDLALNNRDIDATFKDFEVIWRHYFWEHSPLQPYGLLGLVLDSQVELEDGSTNSGTGNPVDAKLKDGVGVSVGAGAALYTLPWVVFYGQGIYRFLRYETGEGFPGEFPLNNDTDADGWQISFGAALRVLPPR